MSDEWRVMKCVPEELGVASWKRVAKARSDSDPRLRSNAYLALKKIECACIRRWGG